MPEANVSYYDILANWNKDRPDEGTWSEVVAVEHGADPEEVAKDVMCHVEESVDREGIEVVDCLEVGAKVQGILHQVPRTEAMRILEELLAGYQREERPQTFTAVCLYPDYLTSDFGADVYVNAAEGQDGYEAAAAVQRMAAQANGDDVNPEDFRVIAVIAGDVTLELDATNF